MKREIKFIKSSLNHTLDKPPPVKKKEERKPHGERLPNSPYFKLVITPKRRPKT